MGRTALSACIPGLLLSLLLLLPQTAAALSKKSIYAAPISYPMGCVAQQAGMKTLANLAKEDIPFVHVGISSLLGEIAKENPKAKQARPEHFFDNSLVQELVDEGFFVSL